LSEINSGQYADASKSLDQADEAIGYLAKIFGR